MRAFIACVSLFVATAASAADLPSPRHYTNPHHYDAALRIAWHDRDLREDAAEALHELHAHPKFRLPDDERIGNMRRTLGSGFTVTRTPHYVVVSDCSASWVRDRLRLLKRTRHQFFRFTEQIGYPACPPGHRLVCIIFSEHADYATFAREHDGMTAPWAGGYYSSRYNHIVMYDDRSSPKHRETIAQVEAAERLRDEHRAQAERARAAGNAPRAEAYSEAADEIDTQIREAKDEIERYLTNVSTAKVIHEAAHQLAYNSGLQLRTHAYPFWLTEGLAAAFETHDPDASFGPRYEGGTRGDRFDELADAGGLPDLASLLGWEEPRGSVEEINAAYHLSWALARWLVRHEPERLRDYLLEVAAWSAPGPNDHAELFRRHFGDPERVDRRLRNR